MTQTFPILEELSTEEFAKYGYVPRCVSIFDHWLTREEVENCGYMSFKEAMKSGLKELYLEQETRFLGFYRNLLSSGGVYRTDWRANLLAFHSAWDDGLAAIIRANLREERLFELYSDRFSLRIIGGYDRTDLLLFKSLGQIPAVMNLSTRHGLFLLPRT